MPEGSSPHRAFLSGGGAMGAMTRELDAARTALGAVAQWPQSLRTTVSICLESRFPILVWWGPELVMLYNDAYAPMLGEKHPRALGQRGREVWPEIWHIIGPMLEGVLARGEATWSEDQMLPLERHGFVEECYFTFSYSPIRDESGGVGGVFTAVTETTERVLAERRLATLRELASESHGASTDDEACAKAAAALAGNVWDLPFVAMYSIGAVATRIGAGPEEAFPRELALDDPRWPIAEVLRNRRPVLVEGLGANLPGGPWPEPIRRATVVPIAASPQDEPYGVMIVGISPRRTFDDSYASFVALVARHVATAIAAARALSEERRRAEALAALDRAKTVFFSNVSHELRTPLTLMLGPLEEALASDLDGPTRSALDVVSRNGRRLLRLVNTLLDFSRIEAGRTEASFEPVDVGALTMELASSFERAAAGARIELRCECEPVEAWVDREMWEKIVLNLVSNALKHTFVGAIVVRAHESDGHAVLDVEDSGVGIPENEVPFIFDRFHRVRGARARTHEGSGIGLSLVRELVVLHGGTIDVHSVVDRGSRFTVRVPLGVAHLPAERRKVRPGRAPTLSAARPFVEEAMRWVERIPSTPPTASGARPRVLLADDNADMRAYLVRILSERWDVEAVSDGSAALAAARARRPDLVLTDVMMPGLDGFELLRALRRDANTRNVPVVMLSARAGEESTIDGLEAGADDYLVKPFSARELVARVSAHLATARVRDEESRRKDEFIAMLGHELRNPLSAIGAAAQLLERSGERDGWAARLSPTLNRQVKQLSRLVDDLLDVSRITRGRITLAREPLELTAAVSRAVETVRPALSARRHRIDEQVREKPLIVDADPARLEQIVTNLLTNAVKFTPPGGHIVVSSERVGDDAVLRVQDDGIGLTPDLMPQVFELFVQGPRKLDRAEGGLGIGLSLVRSLVTLHGGVVDVYSEGAGKGSTFTVRLPLCSAASTTEAVDEPALPPFARRVLVVDDNADALELMCMLLNDAGHEVVVAGNGAEALSIVDRVRPDVAVLDLGMPGMDGFELAARFRAHPTVSQMRLVALSGYGTEEFKKKSRAAGFDVHLTKPVDIDTVLAAIGTD